MNWLNKIPRTHTVLLAVAIGFAVAAGFLPGGYDAFHYFLRQPPSTNYVPAWLHLFTTPFSWLGWPLSWCVFTFFCITIVGATAIAWDNRRWWVVVLSAPMLWNIWLGQVEPVSVLGLLIAWLVLYKNAHPMWMGLAWLALTVKPQASLGVLILVSWWFLRKKGWRAVAWAAFLSLVLIAFTLVLWPGWPVRWISSISNFTPTSTWVAAIWPYGLLAIPLVFVPRKIDPLKRLRMAAAVTLLAVPYFSLYHTLLLLTLTPSPLALALSWALILPVSFIPETWMTWGWVLPAAILLVDLVTSFDLNLRRIFTPRPSRPA